MVTGGDGPGTSSCGRDGVMSFLVLPPEVNSALMFAGAGSGPTLAAAAAWDGLAAELGQAANSFS